MSTAKSLRWTGASARPGRALACLMLSVGMAAAAGACLAQAEPPAVPAAQAPAASPAEPALAAPVRREPRPQTSPTWGELRPAQQQALAPLAGSWGRLSAAHKRKWLALSRNYAGMTPDEQALLHSRMREWAALSPQQRTQARLNFAETKSLPADDKKALWEAYQSLSPEEKRKLAARGARRAPPPAAAAVQPQPGQKLADVPGPADRPGARTPRIAATPDKVDRQTLLPTPGTLPAPQN